MSDDETKEIEKLIEDTDLEVLEDALWMIRERNKLNRQTEGTYGPTTLVEYRGLGWIRRDAQNDKEADDGKSEKDGNKTPRFPQI